MADYTKLIPFILSAEGGYVKDPADKGGETNKGITWSTWVSFFGLDSESHKRFLVMSDSDWSTIFKKGFWDKCCGDLISNQSIANMIADWVWGSGEYYPQLKIQQLLNTHFKQHLTEDGIVGKVTITCVNNVNQAEFYELLIALRKQYYHNIVLTAQKKNDHSQDKFLQGWLNRVDNLVRYNFQQ